MKVLIRVRRSWFLWCLLRLERRIDPARFDHHLSQRIDAILVQLGELEGEGRALPR